MIYQIDISKRTRREIEQLPGHMRQRIKRAIAQLAFDPRPTHAVELRGPLKDRYKIVLDTYRIVYWIQDDIAIVQVLKAGKKTPGFYDDL
ncbi:MAG: type II toxin-antitoxin system RelE/ParE family toxin [Anaerolinea sp.]|nr:type II toxin-antitoxin system RelE/ParE family toxin [Anaerolinea sp.]HRI56487.1 type II toxin-antitoxin system RelE/ParE family toxin [Anaerolineae bacterium]